MLASSVRDQFAMLLMTADNRSKFLGDEETYLDDWAMTPEQREAVLARDFNRMISLGEWIAKNALKELTNEKVRISDYPRKIYRKNPVAKKG